MNHPVMLHKTKPAETIDPRSLHIKQCCCGCRRFGSCVGNGGNLALEDLEDLAQGAGQLGHGRLLGEALGDEAGEREELRALAEEAGDALEQVAGAGEDAREQALDGAEHLLEDAVDLLGGAGDDAAGQLGHDLADVAEDGGEALDQVGDGGGAAQDVLDERLDLADDVDGGVDDARQHVVVAAEGHLDAQQAVGDLAGPVDRLQALGGDAADDALDPREDGQGLVAVQDLVQVTVRRPSQLPVSFMWVRGSRMRRGGRTKR